MVGIVASEPFSNDADRAYGQLRTIARMAHELQAMEEQLKTLYGSAMELVAPETPVLVALSDRHTSTRAHPNVTGVRQCARRGREARSAKTTTKEEGGCQDGRRVCKPAYAPERQ